MGDRIELTASDGHKLDAYRALPSGKPRGGLVVIQEIFGVNGHIRAVADSYAEAGYAVISPSIFDRLQKNVELGYTPEGTAEGRALRTKLGWDAPLLDIEAAAAALESTLGGFARTSRATPPNPRSHGRVGTLGYCWGGSLSFLAACRLEVAASVAYYGGQIIQFVEERPKVPVLMHFGERDGLISAADRQKIAEKQPAAQIFVYPAGHGFNCTERQDFEPESARLARERTLAFLAAHVG